MNINARPREHITPELRQRVLERDNYTCRYCEATQGPFHLDHVYPHSKGGETTFENLVAACRSCNIRKHDKVGIWPAPIPAQSLRKMRPKIRPFHRKEVVALERPLLFYEQPFFWRRFSAWMVAITVISYDAFFVYHFVANQEKPGIISQIVSISLAFVPMIPAWIESKITAYNNHQKEEYQETEYAT